MFNHYKFYDWKCQSNANTETKDDDLVHSNIFENASFVLKCFKCINMIVDVGASQRST